MDQPSTQYCIMAQLAVGVCSDILEQLPKYLITGDKKYYFSHSDP